MLLSEKDAKTKWCPFAISAVRRYEDSVSTINRRIGSGKPDVDCFCIAADCMMWRAVSVTKDNEKVKLGYCGLAGKPEIEESKPAAEVTPA
ncbi:hypothetical protein HUU05_17910 [candidate division KSB1 bacterium]|nr:hypothetical protein [candidate division KSB1 bacterium]